MLYSLGMYVYVWDDLRGLYIQNCPFLFFLLISRLFIFQFLVISHFLGPFKYFQIHIHLQRVNQHVCLAHKPGEHIHEAAKPITFALPI